MTGDESASSAEKQEVGEAPPPWQPPGWQVPEADPSVPPYAAPAGWQPPAPAPPPYAPQPSQYPVVSGAGWHGAGLPTSGGYPPPQPYGQPQYGQQYPSGQYPYGGYPRPGDTNGYAIASLVCSLVGILVVVVGPVLGIVFGIVGLRQVGTSGQSGRGLAIAGIVIGGIALLLDVVGIIGLAVGSGDSSGGGGLSTLHAASLITALRSSL